MGSAGSVLLQIFCTPATVRELRELAKEYAPSMLCLVETQLEGSRVENLSDSIGFNKSYSVSSTGRSGGLCLFWNDEIKVEIIDYSEYHIDTVVEGLADNPFRATFVYGEAQVNERHKTWDMLQRIVINSNLSWVAMGDFNEVLLQSKHDGVGPRSQGQINMFWDAVDTCGLLDLGFEGNMWTFEKRVTGGSYTRVRLDRALISPDWSMQFPAATLKHLNAASSDHVPIFLSLGLMQACDKGPKRFRYETMWERDESLRDLLDAGWKSTQSESPQGIKNKLAALSTNLTSWDRNHFGNVRQVIRQLKRQLELLCSAPGRRAPSHLETKVADRLVELFHREEILWRQRARLEWLASGDKNTYFFHLRASRRHMKNQIKALSRADGSIAEDQAELEGMRTQFYEQLYTAEGTQNMHQVIDTIPRKITPDMREVLDAPYSKEEVKTTLFQMFPIKSPGPDGFPAHFFQRH